MCAFYTFQWSSEVYEAFLERHARGSEFVRDLFNIGKDEPVLWISEKSRKWPDFKKAVKYVEKSYASVERWANYDYETVVKYYRRVINRRALSQWPEVVDKVPKQLTLREHTKETEVGSGRTRSGPTEDL